MAYEHRQHSPFIATVLIVMLLVMLATLVLTQPRYNDIAAMPIVAIIVAFAAIGLFTRLTTRVADGCVSWYFGWGFPRGSRSLAEIARVEMTQTNLLEGWGIHWTIWHGWVWNVWGFQAVQIFGNDGSSITIGTDDPDGLVDAIKFAMKS